MNVETYDEGMEDYSSNHRNIGPYGRMIDTKSQDYSNVFPHRTKSGDFSSSHRNVGRHTHNHRNIGNGTHIMSVESNTRYDDYGSGRSCHIKLVCNTTKERIKPGSCQFT